MAPHLHFARSGSPLSDHSPTALPFSLENISTSKEGNHSNLGRKDDYHYGNTNNDKATHSLKHLPTGTPGPTFSEPARLHAAAESFKAALVEKLAMAPNQSFSLPPSYIMDFVRKVFTEDLCLVDFTQALNAMDYLRDMEQRRRREMAAVLERLGVSVVALDREMETLKVERPQVAEWVAATVGKARRIESLYTQVYICLRRWTLINEMRLEPFNKPNCVAMLNTLYPANYASQPTPQLTPMVLNSHRNAFFRYILAVESNGKAVLSKLEQQGKRPQDANAWPIVRDVLDKYLRTANDLVQDCGSVRSDEDVQPQSHAMEKRTDSGISMSSSKSSSSFNSQRRPSTTQEHYLDTQSLRSGSSTSSHKKSASNGEPLPIIRPEQIRQKEIRKVGNTLERLAREIKRMRSRSSDRQELDTMRPQSRSRGSSESSQDEIDHFALATAPLPPLTATSARFPEHIRGEDDFVAPLPPSTPRRPTIKKMKSASNLGHREKSSTSFGKNFTVERRLGSASAASGSTTMLLLPPQTPTIERKYSFGSLPKISLLSQPFNISDEERVRMIARARAEKENHSAESVHRYTPVRSRSDTLQSSTSNSSLDTPAPPVQRKASPGRNKLRDFYGLNTLEVPTTSFKH